MPAIAFDTEAEWHSIRERHVGGSEIACLFYEWRLPDGSTAVHHLFEPLPDDGTLLGCCSPFKTGYRLWLEKAGRLMPDDLDEVERIQAGNFLEPAIAEWAKTKFDWSKLRKVRRYLTHEAIPGWGSSLDYEVNEAGRPPVELKNVDGGKFRREWTCDGKDIVGLPLQYALQVQSQIGVAAADHGWIVACIGGNELRRGRIERHQPTQERIAEAVTAFWLGVANGLEPEHYADFETVAQVHREGVKVDDPVEIDAPNFDLHCRRYLRWKKHADFVDTYVSNIKGRLALHVGEATKVRSVGHRITWPAVFRAAKQIPARWQDESSYRGAFLVTPIKED